MADKTTYNDMAFLLSSAEAAETAAGVGGTASTDPAGDAWGAKFSCVLVANSVEDSFTVTITHEYVLNNWLGMDITLATVEAWADTIGALFTIPQ